MSGSCFGELLRDTSSLSDFKFKLFIGAMDDAYGAPVRKSRPYVRNMLSSPRCPVRMSNWMELSELQTMLPRGARTLAAGEPLVSRGAAAFGCRRRHHRLHRRRIHNRHRRSVPWPRCLRPRL